MVTLRDKGHEVICLSSGEQYSFLNPHPHLEWKEVDGFKRATVVNSPVFAPGHFTFYDMDSYNVGRGLDRIPADLAKRYKDIDVFHFQNLEGLTSHFFYALKEAFPRARIILSAHNYNLVCPQVNLWFREHQVCQDYRLGNACVNCLIAPDRTAFERNVRRVERAQRVLGLGKSKTGTALVTFAVRAAVHVKRRIQGTTKKPISTAASRNIANGVVVTSSEKAQPYRHYREGNIILVAELFDQVLAVSRRTRAVLIARGVPADKISVSYIGTAQYEHAMSAVRKMQIDGHLHLAFFGYMRADKGFYFLLDALFSLTDELAKNISVTIAAPIWESYPINRLRGLAHRFRKITVLNGYKHSELSEILADVDLGVVPVLWEDNLPQVAIEFVSRGIPILTSNRGGAQEIGENPNFIFESGSARDFCAKIESLLTGRVPLGDFWKRAPKIFSMEEHLSELITYYQPAASDARAPAPAATTTLEHAS